MLFKIVFPQCHTAASAVSSVKGFAFGMGDYLESEVIDFSEQFIIKQNITKTVIHPPGCQSCFCPGGVLCSPRLRFQPHLDLFLLAIMGRYQWSVPLRS